MRVELDLNVFDNDDLLSHAGEQAAKDYWDLYSASTVSDLEDTISDLREELREAQRQLATVLEDFEAYREANEVLN